LKKTIHKNNEETRRLQITGGSTFVLSLPKKWISQSGLEKGSRLRVREEENGTLTIIPPGIEKSEKTESAIIKTSTKESSSELIRKTVSVYLEGYNIINIRAINQKEIVSTKRNSIKTFARNMLVGTEIVTDTSKELTLQVLLSYPELSVPSALRRMAIITASMHRDALRALKNQNNQLASDVRATDYEVNRFHLYIIRQLKMAIQNPRIISEIGLKNQKDCLGYRLITKMVERTADHATNIAKYVLLLKKKLNEDLLLAIEEMENVALLSFERSIESLFKRDFDLADSVIEIGNKIIPLEKKALLASKEMDSEETANLRLVIESVRRIAEYSMDIAEVVLNMTVNSILG
jgi:phosphate uptake regulator